MAAFHILGLGEVLWDLLPSGKQLGGAPANFVSHAHALGADARLISRIGADPLGREILERWQTLSLPTPTLTIDSSAPTGTVSVTLSAEGQPHFIIHENVAWDRIEAEPMALAAAQKADAICFGSLAQRAATSRLAIGQILAASRPNALRIFDINLRAPYFSDAVLVESLAAANVLKLNEQELPVLAKLFELGGSTRDQLHALAERFELRLIALTKGAEGSVLQANGAWCEHPGLPTPVRDTVGAGDSFTAAVTLGLLHGWPLEKISEIANQIAAFVCSQPGATPLLPIELRSHFSSDSRCEPDSRYLPFELPPI